MRRAVLVVAGAVVAALLGAAAFQGTTPTQPGASADASVGDSVGASSSEPTDSPNVVVVVLDDARVDDLAQMPATQRLVADQGTTFTDVYSSFPQCCPARATLLTGQYSHNHEVLGNKSPFGFDGFDDTSSIATYLDDEYLTSLNGKYFNGYESRTYVPPGWNRWSSPHKKLYNTRFQRLTVDGQPRTARGFTPVLQGQATVDLVHEAAELDEPLFAYLAMTVPHTGMPKDDVVGAPWVPRRWRDTYRGPLLPRSPAFAERDTSDKRRYVRRLDRLTPEEVQDIRDQTQRRRDALMAADRQVKRIVHALRRTGELDDTVLMVLSDNGQLHGEHNMRGKLQPYQESVQVPLVVRGPGFEDGGTYDGLVGLQDITPTILDATGTELPDGAPEPDGVSLLGLLDGSVADDRSMLLEMTSSRRSERTGRKYSGPEGTQWYAQGLVTPSGWKYVSYLSGEEELFNLRRDPWELRNLSAARSPGIQAVLEDLRVRLDDLEDCAGDTCR